MLLGSKSPRPILDGAIGALDWTSAERKRLAKKSVDFHCPTCGCKVIDLLPKIKPKSENDENKPKSKFQKEIEKLQQLQHAQHGEQNAEEEGDEKDEKAADAETTKDKGTESKKEPPIINEPVA